MTDYLARIAKLAEEATEGPWFEGHTQDGAVFSRANGLMIGRAHLLGLGKTRDERNANAALIAEAPRMAALLAVAGEMAEVLKEVNGAINAAFAAGMEERENGSARRQAREVERADATRQSALAALARWQKELNP